MIEYAATPSLRINHTLKSSQNKSHDIQDTTCQCVPCNNFAALHSLWVIFALVVLTLCVRRAVDKRNKVAAVSTQTFYTLNPGFGHRRIPPQRRLPPTPPPRSAPSVSRQYLQNTAQHTTTQPTNIAQHVTNINNID